MLQSTVQNCNVAGTTGNVDFTRYLSTHPEHPSDSIALIILNSPIRSYSDISVIWRHASFRICADGGANRLYNLIQKQCHDSHLEDAFNNALGTYSPDVIYGDLDSLDDHVRETYTRLGTEISRDGDQYSTDFGKAVKQVCKRLPSVRDVLVLGSVGGRVDQGIGLLHELYREQRARPGIRFWLFSEGSISTVLNRGGSTLQIPLDGQFVGRNVGILPLYGPAEISTEGLEWDVRDWPTEMGGQVSTSNHVVKEEVVVRTDREVLFTVDRAGKSW